MKAISLWQPWASLWLSPAKVHETRHWATSHRGPLLVHAAKRFEKDLDTNLATILRAQFGTDWFKTLPTGALLGVIRLTSCVLVESLPTNHADSDDFASGNYEPGRFAWGRSPTFKVFETPIPYRGAQGFFEVPDAILPIPLSAA